MIGLYRDKERRRGSETQTVAERKKDRRLGRERRRQRKYERGGEE